MEKQGPSSIRNHPIGTACLSLALQFKMEWLSPSQTASTCTRIVVLKAKLRRGRRDGRYATVKRYHYDSHEQLRTHLADFMAAYNFARRLKTLNGLTPYEYICKIWTSEPDRFILNPIHQMPGLNT